MQNLVLMACVLLLIGTLPQAQKPQAQQPSSTEPLAFDPGVPLVARLISPPASAADTASQGLSGRPKLSPTPHRLTNAERAQVDEVLQDLPAFTREVFRQHLRSLTFVDGIPGNGMTSKEPGTGVPVFNIVLRAGLLRENISQFLTRKERSYYAANDPHISLSIEAGSRCEDRGCASNLRRL